MMGPDLYILGAGEISKIDRLEEFVEKEIEQINKNFMFILNEMKRTDQRLSALEEESNQEDPPACQH